MRYACYTAIHPDSASDVFDERVFEWEKCLLKSLLDVMAVKTKKNYGVIHNVDVEMAWSIVGMLVLWSSRTTIPKQKSIFDKVIANLWIESMNALMQCQMSCASNEHADSRTNKSAGPSIDTSTTDNHESLMVQTINSLLDGCSDENATSTKDNHWEHDFSSAVASSFRSYLVTTGNPKVTKSILLRMIQWSQQKDSIATDVYCLVLQYLNLCLHRALGETKQATYVTYPNNRFNTYFFNDDDDTTDAEESFNTIKSFLFYGLIVLCNDPGIGTSDESTPNLNINRAEIYCTFLGLWQLLGPEWFYGNSTTPLSNLGRSTSNTSDWWQRSDFANKSNDNNRLGQTWQLCTLVRLAAGEFRLSMGRWMACIEDGCTSESSTMPQIVSCAQIVIQALQLMTSLADEEDEDVINQTNENGVDWTPDAILHTRHSLQDALNAAIQYFNENDCLFNDKECDTSNDRLQSEWEEIGKTCCLIIGLIAPELELDQLLHNYKEEKSSSSSFVGALSACILFCGSDATTTKACNSQKFGHDELLSCLLPCIASVIDNATTDDDDGGTNTKESAQQVLVSLCNDGNLVQIISEYLNRLHRQFLVEVPDQQVSILSIARLASVIITGLVQLGSSERPSSKLLFTKSELAKMNSALMQWGNLLHPTP
jgi:hypothetical protein